MSRKPCAEKAAHHLSCCAKTVARCTEAKLWRSKLFFYFFQMGMVNSYILSKSLHPRIRLTLMQYMIEIVTDLAGAVDGEPSVPAAAMEPRRNRAGDPFPLRIPPTEKKAHPTKQCAQCSDKPSADGKRPRKETWLSKECKVPLCPDCFYPYHRPHAQA